MFSLRTLLLLVAIAAIGAVGLTTRNVWWAGVMAMLTLASVAAAIVGSIICRGPHRWFNIGFGVFAACYLFITLSLVFEPFARTLFTSRVIGASWRALDVPRPQRAEGSYRYSQSNEYEDVEEYALLGYLVVGETNEMREWTRELRSFFIIGHCLWAWFFGFLGSLLAGYLSHEWFTQNDIKSRPSGGGIQSS